MQHLVVITGPIGAGKSTVSDGLGRRFKAAGIAAAVVDLDDVVFMQHAPVAEMEQSWARGRAAHASLVSAWLEAGVDAVIAHGPFHTPDDLSALYRGVPAGIRPRLVMLLVPYEVALARVSVDGSRGIAAGSRDPAFLRRTHERFNQVVGSLPQSEWTFDTVEASPETIVDTLWSGLHADRENR